MGLAPAAHHRLLIKYLQRVADGEIRNLMVFMPPGSAKSTYASVLFPTWFLSTGEHLRLVAASATEDLTGYFSREIQRYVGADPHMLRYALTSERSDLWGTTNGSQYRCKGVGGTLTGFRADLGIIDDPVKDRAAADSDTERDNVWNWYTSVFLTRLKPGGRQIIIQTRWHEDDLSGRLLSTQAKDWEVLSLPAVAGEDDQLGRAQGEFLWNDGAYGGMLVEKLRFYEEAGAMRDWYALYQQDPRPLDGGIFQPAKIRLIDAPPRLKRVMRGWDLAATAQVGTRNPDWTVGVKLGLAEDDTYVVLDVFRDRGGPQDVECWLQQTAEADTPSVRISLPQDPGQAGKSQAQSFIKKLAGFDVKATPETGDKATRAAPFAAQLNAGNVSVLKRPWTNAYIEELRGFPSGSKDDQVDASSRAFNAMLRGGGCIVQRLGY